MINNEYLAGIYADVEKRNAGEKEFLQAVLLILSVIRVMKLFL